MLPAIAYDVHMLNTANGSSSIEILLVLKKCVANEMDIRQLYCVLTLSHFSLFYLFIYF